MVRVRDVLAHTTLTVIRRTIAALRGARGDAWFALSLPMRSPPIGTGTLVSVRLAQDCAGTSDGGSHVAIPPVNRTRIACPVVRSVEVMTASQSSPQPRPAAAKVEKLDMIEICDAEKHAFAPRRLARFRVQWVRKERIASAVSAA